MSSTAYATLGYPADTVIRTNGDVLVSVSKTGGTAPLPSYHVGIQVFQDVSGTLINPCANQLSPLLHLPDISGSEAVTQAMGLKAYPGHPESLGVAVENQGIDLLTVQDVRTCTFAYTPPTNVQQPKYNPPSGSTRKAAPGTFDLVFTPNGAHAFVANEYGVDPNASPSSVIGTVGVVQVMRDSTGNFAGTSPIATNSFVYIPGSRAIPGITLSHDGRYLYITSEIADIGAQDPTNSQNPILTGQRCYQEYDESNPPAPAWNGLLTVIDVAAAIAGQGQASILRTIAAGCSPVRVAETADGKRIWLTVRGDNRVLAFDVEKLLSSNPNQSVLGYADSGGTAPVGLALFHNEQLLAVTNSNRFTPYNPPSDPDVTNVAILNVQQPAGAYVVNSLTSTAKGDFPRNVRVGPDDGTLYVTNFNAGNLQVIRTTVSP